ncbi:MAG: class I SAM-dependent methyltransferase [Chloroflexota bacterium]
MPFNPLDYRLALERAEHLTDTTAWHELTPLAFVLVQMLQPRVIVELGTHKGDSYLAFCQAVARLDLACACYAVDTWKGDAQAGYYDDAVYDELRAYHDVRYGHFSSLVRSTFDEAHARFDGGSIDLLHIDGLHTYEACLHDLELWLPKVSPRGVVLLHDTNVREKDFGVWRVWEGVCHKYPSFDFTHGNGLGLLQVGLRAPEPFVDFLTTCRTNPAVAEYFGRLGSGIVQEGQLADSRAHAANLQAELADLRGHTANLEDATRHYRAWIADLEQQQATMGARLAALEQQQSTLAARLARAVDNFVRRR